MLKLSPCNSCCCRLSWFFIILSSSCSISASSRRVSNNPANPAFNGEALLGQQKPVSKTDEAPLPLWSPKRRKPPLVLRPAKKPPLLTTIDSAFAHSQSRRLAIASFTPEDLWDEESLNTSDRRQFSWRDVALRASLGLHIGFGTFEATSIEKQAAIDDAESMKERRWAMGVGESRRIYSNYRQDKFSSMKWSEGAHIRTQAHFAASGVRGDHDRNEDAFWWLETNGIAAMAVFDGHGGPDASDLAATEVLRWVPAFWMQWLRSNSDKLAQMASQVDPHPGLADFNSSIFWRDAMKKMFMSAQKKLGGVARTQGTTGSAVIVDRTSRQGVVAWVGDSQVLHARRDADGGWKIIWKSGVHHCENDVSWKHRLYDNKSWCDTSREKPYVCVGKTQFKNCIGVTRSLGDMNFLNDGAIMDTPEFHNLLLQEGDILLTASDGIWDVLDDDAVLSHLNEKQASTRRGNACKEDLDGLAHALTSDALIKWNRVKHNDDVSVVAWCMPGETQRSHTYVKVEDLVKKYIQFQEVIPEVRSITTGEASGDEHGNGSKSSMNNWLAQGGLGEYCRKIPRIGMARLLDYVQMNSTCGPVWMGENKTQETLTCKIEKRPATKDETAFGKCVIPLGSQCSKAYNNGGCQDGHRCSVFPRLLLHGRCAVREEKKLRDSSKGVTFYDSWEKAWDNDNDWE